jgi:2,4-diaminopentanoate dehydrogenase
MTVSGSQAGWSGRYRIAQAMIERPNYELASVWVSNPAKVGKDAGALCGLSDIAAGLDCVMYMPHVNRVDDVW